MNFRKQRSDEVEIGLTPLIDVVFILLIFFMVTTTFNRNSELKIDLPEATTEVKASQEKTIEIAIDASGHFYVNNVQIIGTQSGTLVKAIRKVLGNNKTLPVTIKADGKTPHQAVITAMDAASQLGLNRLSLATSISGQ
ncbi:MAG: ExbD/TolR family protein [bacterium]